LIQRKCECGRFTNQEIIEEEQEVEIVGDKYKVDLLKAVCPECGSELVNDKLKVKNKLRINQAYRDQC